MKHIVQWNTLSEARRFLPKWIMDQITDFMTDSDWTIWCGHFCLMMVTECSFDAACLACQELGGLSKEDIMTALGRFGVESYWLEGEDAPGVPERDLIVHVRDYQKPQWSHWLVRSADGIYFDPGFTTPGWNYGKSCYPAGFIVIDKAPPNSQA